MMIWNKLETARRTGLSVATLRRMMKLGLFPALIQLSPRRVGWSSDEVEQWLPAQRLRQGWF
jgi:predicted DNA-binding transcriptional regulator AlpA